MQAHRLAALNGSTAMAHIDLQSLAHRDAQRLLQRAVLRLAGIVALIVLFALMGCAALPEQVKREASQTLVDARTPLAQIAAAAAPAEAGQSGLRLIPDGDHAL